MNCIITLSVFIQKLRNNQKYFIITYRTNDFSQVIDQIFERNSAWGGLSKEDIELFMEFCERNKREKAEMEHDD